MGNLFDHDLLLWSRILSRSSASCVQHPRRACTNRSLTSHSHEQARRIEAFKGTPTVYFPTLMNSWKGYYLPWHAGDQPRPYVPRIKLFTPGRGTDGRGRSEFPRHRIQTDTRGTRASLTPAIYHPLDMLHCQCCSTISSAPYDFRRFCSQQMDTIQRACIGRCLFEGRGCPILSYDKVSDPVSTRVLSRSLLTLPKKLSPGDSNAPFGSSADGIKSGWIVPPNYTFCPRKLQLPGSTQTYFGVTIA